MTDRPGLGGGDTGQREDGGGLGDGDDIDYNGGGNDDEQQ